MIKPLLTVFDGDILRQCHLDGMRLLFMTD